MSRFSEHPLIGSGPVLKVYRTPMATTHAHNELLQFAVDYGLVGLALGLGPWPWCPRLVAACALTRGLQCAR